MDAEEVCRFISHLVKVNIFIIGFIYPWLLFIGVFLFVTWPSHTTFEIAYWAIMIGFVLLFISIVVSYVIRHFEKKVWSEYIFHRLTKVVFSMFPLVLGIIVIHYYILLMVRNLFDFLDIIEIIFLAIIIIFFILFGRYRYKRDLLKAKSERKIFPLKTTVGSLSSIVKNVLEELMVQYDFSETSNFFKTKKILRYILRLEDIIITIEDQPPAIYIGDIKSKNQELIKKIQQKIDSKT